MKNDGISNDDLDLLLGDDDHEGSHSHGHEDFLDDGPVGRHHDDDELDLDDLDEDELKDHVGGEEHDELDESDEVEGSEEVAAKKGVSPIIIGAACVVGVIASAGAYVAFFKKAPEEQMPMVHTSMPAPKIAELGDDMSIPSTNFTDDNVSNALGHDDSKAPVKTPSLGGLSAKAEASPQKAPVVVSSPAQPGSEPDKALASTAVPPVVAAVPVVPLSDVSEPVHVSMPLKVVANDQSSSLPAPSPAQDDSSLSKEDVQAMVKDAIKQSGTEDIKKQLDKIQLALSSANAHGSTDSVQKTEKDKILAEIKSEQEKTDLLKKEDEDKKIAEATVGKQRLPGFQVVNATRDGNISIIKSPAGRTFALFKGEQFHAANGKNLEVTEILSEGRLVVAGSNWYIDETLVDAPKVASKPIAAQKQVKQLKEVQPQTPVPKAKSSSLSGWSLDGSFEGGGFLVKSPTGEYKTVTKGEADPVLGEIFGIDESGALKTGKGVIKSGG